VAWAPDGQRLAVVNGRTLGLVDVDAAAAADYSPTLRINKTKPVRIVNTTQPIVCVAFSPNGRWLAWGDGAGTVEVRDPAAGALGAAVTFRAHEGLVKALAFSPDSRWLASAGTGSAVKLWDLVADRAAGVPPVRLLKGHRESPVNGVSFAPNGRRLASAGSDGTVRVWDLGTDQEVLVLVPRLPVAEVDSVAFAPDGRHLVAEAETTIHVWDAPPSP
jgi:WD40 repeat protein